MYRVVDGNICGVLNDYDLAIRVDRTQGPTSRQRTGTLPYMAAELLGHEPPAHMYRHDLESIFYCMLDMTLADTLDSNAKKFRPALWKWSELSTKKVQDQKFLILLSSEYEFMTAPGFHFRFDYVLGQLAKMFSEGYTALKDQRTKEKWARNIGIDLPKFDALTCNGAIAFDRFEEILTHLDGVENSKFY